MLFQDSTGGGPSLPLTCSYHMMSSGILSGGSNLDEVVGSPHPILPYPSPTGQ